MPPLERVTREDHNSPGGFDHALHFPHRCRTEHGLTLATGLAQAASPADACANLAAARSALVAMIDEPDAAKQDGYVEQIHGASAALDADLAAMAGGPDAAKADAFKPVWEAFKETRETEIIPAVKAGDTGEGQGARHRRPGRAHEGDEGRHGLSIGTRDLRTRPRRRVQRIQVTSQRVARRIDLAATWLPRRRGGTAALVPLLLSPLATRHSRTR